MLKTTTCNSRMVILTRLNSLSMVDKHTRNIKMPSAALFQIGQLEIYHTLSSKTPLASYFILYPFLKYNLIFKAINFSQPLYLSSLIRSSSVTCGNRLSVYSICPRKATDRYGFATATSGNGTGSQLVSDHRRPFQVLDVNPRLTCLDLFTHHHSPPCLAGSYWVTDSLGLRTVPFWFPAH